MGVIMLLAWYRCQMDATWSETLEQKPLWRNRNTFGDNIKLDFQDRRYEGVKWIYMARNGNQ